MTFRRHFTIIHNLFYTYSNLLGRRKKTRIHACQRIGGGGGATAAFTNYTLHTITHTYKRGTVPTTCKRLCCFVQLNVQTLKRHCCTFARLVLFCSRLANGMEDINQSRKKCEPKLVNGIVGKTHVHAHEKERSNEKETIKSTSKLECAGFNAL